MKPTPSPWHPIAAAWRENTGQPVVSVPFVSYLERRPRPTRKRTKRKAQIPTVSFADRSQPRERDEP